MAKKRPKKRVKAGTSKAESAKRRALFVEEYISNGGNATQAAITAGFSPKGARAAASRLLTDNNIGAEVIRRRAELVEKAQLSSEETLRSMARAVKFDPRKLFAPVIGGDGKPEKDEHGRMKMRRLEVWELDDDTALAIQGVEFDEIKAGGFVIGQTMKLKACDRNVAREQAHKFHGHYQKDNDQLGTAVARIFKIPAKA